MGKIFTQLADNDELDMNAMQDAVKRVFNDIEVMREMEYIETEQVTIPLFSRDNSHKKRNSRKSK